MRPVTHHLAIDLEEHFQSATAQGGIPRRRWDRFPARLDRTVATALHLLSRNGVKATFFVGDWIASRHAGLVAGIAAAGHEIACSFERADEAEAVLRRVEAAAGRVVHGCRVAPAAAQGLTAARLSAMGLHYVLGPADGDAAGLCRFGPVTAGGEHLRLLPNRLVPRHLAGWAKAESPQVFSFRLWELDPEVPRLTLLSRAERIRAYRYLPRFAGRLEGLLQAAPFGPLRDGLGLAEEIAAPAAPAPAPAVPPPVQVPRGEPVSIVVPCFNEEAGLAYLANALSDVEAGFGRRHPLNLVLVDDGSTDGTWAEMQRLFGGEPNVSLVRHPANRGIGAAIQTGILAAQTEIVAVMDSDCSYDPARIEEMVPLLEPDVALVTASPYHPLGGVEGVPEWRLFLSRGASWMYRMVLRNKLATYTSCFRVCRRSAVAGLALRHEGYIGVVEMLAQLDLAGRRIAEHPVVLEARLLGQSKIRIVRVIAGHLKFLSEIAVMRLRARTHADLIKVPE